MATSAGGLIQFLALSVHFESLTDATFYCVLEYLKKKTPLLRLFWSFCVSGGWWGGIISMFTGFEFNGIKTFEITFGHVFQLTLVRRMLPLDFFSILSLTKGFSCATPGLRSAASSRVTERSCGVSICGVKERQQGWWRVNKRCFNITQWARDLKCSRTYNQRVNRWGKVCQISAGWSKKLSFHTRTRRWNLRALLPLQWHERRQRHWFFFSFSDKPRDRERAISWFPLTARSGLVLRNVWLFGLYVPFNAAVSTQPFRCATQRICHFNTTAQRRF